eukprot:CAMPEP_0170503408 /NCGR_PEP_ID=MMETSP0208-20121228/44645_1 /TAXON_ID=197538 /ORGANISM="Strombidium inclinatum, Strain S3" /LENGTH=99 /DNA_ID=CAMNT_0010783055 /DNA_START=1088 /DNA_END=1387 /DNA_ORIENTATION=-
MGVGLGLQPLLELIKAADVQTSKLSLALMRGCTIVPLDTDHVPLRTFQLVDVGSRVLVPVLARRATSEGLIIELADAPHDEVEVFLVDVRHEVTDIIVV